MADTDSATDDLGPDGCAASHAVLEGRWRRCCHALPAVKLSKICLGTLLVGSAAIGAAPWQEDEGADHQVIDRDSDPGRDDPGIRI